MTGNINNFTATIYKYYEPGVRIVENVDGTDKFTDNYSFACKFCKEHNIRSKEGKEFTVNASSKTSSNLSTHLKKNGHEEVYAKYQEDIKLNPSLTTKRKLQLENSPLNSPSSKQSKLSMGLQSPSIVTAPKYTFNHPLQKSRYFCLLTMLIKCMLPLSLVERIPFREFLSKFDPSFTCPNRDSLKKYGINHMKGTLTCNFYI
jgi:hypothetical protein